MLVDRRFADHDRLEPAFERRVFLTWPCGTQVERAVAPMHCSSPRAMRRLDDVGRVDPCAPRPRRRSTAACASSSMNRMISPAAPAGASSITRFRCGFFEARRGSLVPGKQAGKVDAVITRLSRKRLGNLSLDNALGQAFGDRRLADAGFADEGRVVFGPPREDLNDALDLRGPADDRGRACSRGRGPSGSRP